jgi:hypothetical protein
VTCPASARATTSTTSSVAKVTTHDATSDRTSASRGNQTFLTRPLLTTSEPMPLSMQRLRKAHGSSPHSSQSAKTSRPLGSPGGTCTLSSTPNTTV